MIYHRRSSLPTRGPPRQTDSAPFCRPIPTYHLPLRTADSGLIIVDDGSLFFITINARDSDGVLIFRGIFFSIKNATSLMNKNELRPMFRHHPSAIGENTHSCRQADNITGHCTRIPVFRSYDRHHHPHHRHHKRRRGKVNWNFLY